MNELILLLSVYGSSKLLTEYDGFLDIFYKLRLIKWLKMLTCTVCTSVWIGVIFSAIYWLGLTIILIPLAIIGAVILLEKL